MGDRRRPGRHAAPLPSALVTRGPRSAGSRLARCRTRHRVFSWDRHQATGAAAGRFRPARSPRRNDLMIARRRWRVPQTRRTTRFGGPTRPSPLRACHPNWPSCPDATPYRPQSPSGGRVRVRVRLETVSHRSTRGPRSRVREKAVRAGASPGFPISGPRSLTLNGPCPRTRPPRPSCLSPRRFGRTEEPLCRFCRRRTPCAGTAPRVPATSLRERPRSCSVAASPPARNSRQCKVSS